MKSTFLGLCILALMNFGCEAESDNNGAVNLADEAIIKLGPEEMPVVDASNRFGFDLYSKLREDPTSENLFFSPYSITVALGMTYGGARGKTEAEMAKVLHFSMPQDELHPLMGDVYRYLNGDGQDRGYQLNVANRLWPRTDFNLLDSFRNLVQESYDADIVPLDFSQDEARLTINRWVEDRTNDKIKELFKPGTLSSDTVLVLTNAIYFKGDWAAQFEKSATAPAPFYGPQGEESEVQMMWKEKEFRLANLDDLQLLELPYRNDALSMLVILPKRRDGLADLEKELSVEKLSEWSDELQKQEVSVQLPKFEMTSKFELSSVLRSMGMSSAFGGSDFSGMNGSDGISISRVDHEAVINVNEEGTEAAAATGVVLAVAAREVESFRADHPFAFVIRDNETGAMLFMGRVVKP